MNSILKNLKLQEMFVDKWFFGHIITRLRNGCTIDEIIDDAGLCAVIANFNKVISKLPRNLSEYLTLNKKKLILKFIKPVRSSFLLFNFYYKTKCREPLEALIASVLDVYGFRVLCNVRAKDKSKSTVELDIVAFTDNDIMIHVSCKNKKADKKDITDIHSTILNLDRTPQINIIVAQEFTSNAYKLAKAVGFIPITVKIDRKILMEDPIQTTASMMQYKVVCQLYRKLIFLKKLAGLSLEEKFVKDVLDGKITISTDALYEIYKCVFYGDIIRRRTLIRKAMDLKWKISYITSYDLLQAI